MDILQLLKHKLKELEYPNINALNNEQVAHIFNSVNRTDFLIWYIEQLDPSICLPFKTKHLMDHIAEIIYENGFCTSSQKNKFVEGDMKLNVLEQTKIIQIMLDHLILVKSNKENLTNYEAVKTDSIEIDDFLNQDINLFPVYGTIKTRTPSERKGKIEEYNREIETINQKIELLKQEENLDFEYDTSDKQVDVNRIKSLEENILNFKGNSYTLLQSNAGCKNDLCAFQDGFKDIVSNCKFEMSNVVKLNECMKIITSFSDVTTERNNEENVLLRDVKLLTQMSDELVKSSDVSIEKV